MKIIPHIPFLATAGLCLLTTISVQAQAPDVKIVTDLSEHPQALLDKFNELRTAGKLLSAEQVKAQLNRESCELNLPKPSTQKLTDREIWRRAKDAHVLVVWFYLGKNTNQWNQTLSGGYFITQDGVLATCHHVLKPNPEFREAYLAAVNEDGEIFPVTEVLATNEKADVGIVRVSVNGPVKPLALNMNTYPGDAAWCYSDPLSRTCYFSKGMINRFVQLPRKGGGTSPRIDVSTDWAPGSSGAAVLDECANAIGHVSEISSAGEPQRTRNSFQSSRAMNTMIIFHYAARAADVLALVKPVTKQTK